MPTAARRGQNRKATAAEDTADLMSAGVIASVLAARAAPLTSLHRPPRMIEVSDSADVRP
jgi:hypothetical protein